MLEFNPQEQQTTLFRFKSAISSITTKHSYGLPFNNCVTLKAKFLNRNEKGWESRSSYDVLMKML